jgi:hypothetical protein
MLKTQPRSKKIAASIVGVGDEKAAEPQPRIDFTE